ncbi:MAG: hypothetical protein D6735_16190 [Acidobacteria bacterium]|nr:MAG: hypothetical protein D6735_16190 [Acidobacteriota bacterium]
MYLDWAVELQPSCVQPIGDYILIQIEPPPKKDIETPYEDIKYYKKPDLAKVIRVSKDCCKCLVNKWVVLDEFATLIFIKDPDDTGTLYALVSRYDISAVSDTKPNISIEKLEYRL